MSFLPDAGVRTVLPHLVLYKNGAILAQYAPSSSGAPLVLTSLLTLLETVEEQNDVTNSSSMTSPTQNVADEKISQGTGTLLIGSGGILEGSIFVRPDHALPEIEGALRPSLYLSEPSTSNSFGPTTAAAVSTYVNKLIPSLTMDIDTPKLAHPGVPYKINTGTLTAPLRLDTLVTVVDAEKFLEYYSTCGLVGGMADFRKNDGASKSDARAVVDLLVDQIEHANVIVINKTDLVSVQARSIVTDIVAALAPHAVMEYATFGGVPLSKVLLTNYYKTQPALGSRIEKMVGSSFNRSFDESISGRSGITSFVYQSNALFHPVRLHNLVTNWHSDNILRSKVS